MSKSQPQRNPAPADQGPSMSIKHVPAPPTAPDTGVRGVPCTPFPPGTSGAPKLPKEF
jgi:hypothetical protein